MDIINILKDELGIKRTQAETAVKLIDEGNTIPFIAQIRKEMRPALWTTRHSGIWTRD